LPRWTYLHQELHVIDINFYSLSSSFSLLVAVFGAPMGCRCVDSPTMGGGTRGSRSSSHTGARLSATSDLRDAATISAHRSSASLRVSVGVGGHAAGVAGRGYQPAGGGGGGNSVGRGRLRRCSAARQWSEQNRRRRPPVAARSGKTISQPRCSQRFTIGRTPKDGQRTRSREAQHWLQW
jgi:hypothetical protein